jgi:hypothetical protein
MLKKYVIAKETWLVVIERSNKCKHQLVVFGRQVGVMQHGGEKPTINLSWYVIMPIVILRQRSNCHNFHLFILLSRFRSSFGLQDFVLQPCIPFLVCHGTFQFLLHMHREKLQPKTSSKLVETEWNQKAYNWRCNKKWLNSHGKR